ncbi:MAG TPA: pantoate--beta-alanine ligase [Vicinamibacteria bacterium]|nr:pantoate--beta-alanine ligase [Vicinamibacteria bacterium]
MRRAATIRELRAWRACAGTVGFVPTMGYLHAGHLSLVERARRESERVVASIFVNPTQFGPREDLAGYPRDLDRDLRLLEAAGCDLVFVPDVAEMFPPGADTFVIPGRVAAPLEGTRRPGHFRGVATIVAKLFNIVRPDRAYFGQKDAQQLAVIRALVRDLDLPVEVAGCPIVREPDGLAMSSRNSYLAPEERRAAPVLHRALLAARELASRGEQGADALRDEMRRAIAREPLARLDYASVADPETFEELDRVAGPALLLVAAHLGRARLIDNLRVEA